MYQKYEKIRNEMGFTDADVCNATGISSATISSWKTGAYVPKVDKLAKIAKFLDIPLEEILSVE